MNLFTRNITTAGTSVPAYTHNGALTNSTSGDPILDFFSVAGSARAMSENDITTLFARAYGANQEIALRAALWVRDARGGAGERETFRRVLRWLDRNDSESLARVLPRVAELGRWDDLLVVQSPFARAIAVRLIAEALVSGNGLCAKWMPRKGPEAAKLRNELGLTPKQYRKTLVSLTNVVETPMCANQWATIDLEKLPSVASARYRKAFKKRIPEKFTQYATAVAKGEAKINAGAILPYDVIKPIHKSYGITSEAEIQLANAQWAALPDFIGDGSFLPIVDVSASMTWTKVSGETTPLDVALSLGLYTSERNKSAFKDVVMTFSDNPVLQRLTGTLAQRLNQIQRMNVGGSTNLQASIKLVLDHAIANRVPAEDMPQMLIVFSDMEFNSCARGTNYQGIQDQYARAGYTMPKVVFWNLNGRMGNNPVTFREDGTALVSGFSPSLMKNLLAQKNTDPLSMMLEVLMQERYALAN